MRQNGNVLFLILIAVALFAALSFAITRSSGSGKTSTAAEKDQLNQATNNNCAANVESTVMRLTMMNGCNATTLSYELPNGANANPDAPTNKKCHVFHPSGGGAYPCGTYLNEIATTSIAPGDTTTIARTGSGIYFRCASWTAGTICTPTISMDGVTFAGTNKLCLRRSGGLDPSRQYETDPPGFRDHMCKARCGTSGAVATASVIGGWSGSSYYVNNDFTITPLATNCQDGLISFRCTC